MIHLGEPEFYRTVYADAFAHDVVLVEGVRSPITQRITRAYRWLAGSVTLNLVLQSAYPQPENGRARIIHADLSGVEFDKLWRTLPLAIRLLVPSAATAMGLHGRWFLTREALAKRVESFEDFPTGRELLDLDPETGGLHKVILQARDERLIAHLLEQIDNPDPDVSRVAVVYGARHMRAVLHPDGCSRLPTGWQ